MTLTASPRARKYTVQGLLGLTAAGLIAAIVVTNTGRDAQAKPSHATTTKQAPPEGTPAQTLSPSEYSHAQKLRRQAALTTDDLAALDLTQAEAQAVLTRLADWCAANEQRLAQAESAVFAAERDLNNLRRKIRTGEATTRESEGLAEKIEAVAQARATHQALLIEGGLSAVQAGAPEQQQAWQRASAMAGRLPVELRHLPSMNEARLEVLVREASRGGMGLEEALSFTEQQQVAAVRERVTQRGAQVRAAESEAMPLPEALRELVDVPDIDAAPR